VAVVVLVGAGQHRALERAAGGLHLGLAPHPDVELLEDLEPRALVSLENVVSHIFLNY